MNNLNLRAHIAAERILARVEAALDSSPGLQLRFSCAEEDWRTIIFAFRDLRRELWERIAESVEEEGDDDDTTANRGS